uniref:Sugar transporter SWEET1 n=1 Tax=Saccoglossus kowalevskii TaxID=10224 RepID=A0ABM0LV66_SACKO|nr:PREDICTED: sugar transporter SWEET1-like [Saccoglossus kowalevskii]
MVYFKYYDLAPDVLIKQLGLAASSVTIAMYASPLAQLREVINSKSTRSMSFPLSVATFIAASLWTLYGFLLDDLYVMIPNIPGMMTSIIRFCLFFIYRSSDKTIT